MGLPCVSLLGSQLAPEDLIGVPQIIDGKTRFCPPAQLVRTEPFVLFLDEINACSHEVQKAFYSLIHEWLEWASKQGIHPLICEFVSMRPDYLFSEPPNAEVPFSTPRSWHMLSDALQRYESAGRRVSGEELERLAFGSIGRHHAVQFNAYVRQVRNQFGVEEILKGEQRWPSAAEHCRAP